MANMNQQWRNRFVARWLCRAIQSIPVVFWISIGISRADVGDEIDSFTPQPPSALAICAIGLAFDGVYLYVNRCGDHSVYRIDPVTEESTPAFELTTSVPERPAGMAFDGKRNGLWTGTQKPRDLISPLKNSLTGMVS